MDIYQIKGHSAWHQTADLAPPACSLFSYSGAVHDAVQTAMWWQGGHMHEFRAGQRYFGKPDPEYPSMGMDPVENERAIVLEKQLPVDPIACYPVCTDGQLACPPDDCGSIPGFYDLVEAIVDPNHEQRKELRDWLGYDFDPMAFSIDSVNLLLLPARRRDKALRK